MRSDRAEASNRQTRLDRDAYERLLLRVEKPGRYLGNERGTVRKDPASVALRFALAFPEVYEIAQSHPGLQILYDLLNRRPDVYAERCYAPWLDLEALLRERNLPLASLETFTPLGQFDIVGFSLQYELTYTNVLMMLERGGIPLRAVERTAEHPLVVAGGPCAFNPEPVADFFDAVLLGDGEEAVHDLCDAYLAWDGRDRSALLDALARVPGVYVPSLYVPEYDARGVYLRTRPARPDLPEIVEKRVLRDLNSVPLLETYVVPNMKIVHGRPSLEVMRGCVKGCRFCQAGYIYRPLRERDPRRVLQQAENAVAATGADELSLLSLSTGDYSCVNPVLTELMNRFSERHIAVSLPSTRVDALAPSLLEQIRRVRKTGFTLAPEAGSQRMRDIIQKEYQEEELIEAARQIFQLGWRHLKLYFMIGLPGENEDDLRGIADLAHRVKRAAPRHAEVTASVSTFVPKPHTPFQWSAQIDVAETEARQSFLRGELQRRGIRFKWHDARASYLEGLISRADRRAASLILTAYRLGCRFDGWTEACRLDLWEQAVRTCGVDPARELGRRLLDQPLPWDHISSGVTKKFLQTELARAVQGLLTPDCSVERCTYCGACDFQAIRNVDYHVAGARGSDHRGETIDHWARAIVDANDPEPGSWEPRGWKKIRNRKKSGNGSEGRGKEPTGRALRADRGGPSRNARPEEVVAADRGARRAPAPAGNDASSVPPAAGATGPVPVTPSQSGLGTAEEWLSAPSEGLGAVHPSAPPAARYRLTYRKLGRARFISHLELIDVFAASLRRAGLPVAFTQGHHPKPRFRFGPGLPVGCESDCETLDVDLTRRLPPDDVRRALDGQLPEGMSVAGARELSLRHPAVESETLAVRYRIDARDAVAPAEIDARLARFLALDSFPVCRKTGKGEKQIDARRLVAGLRRAGDTVVELDLRFTIEGSIKPAELIAAVLGISPDEARALPIRKVLTTYRSTSSASVVEFAAQVPPPGA